MTTARTKILQRLALATEPLAVHQIKAEGVSDTACSARLREIHREGLVIKHKKIGVRFDYWSLVPERDIDFSKPYWAGEK